MVYITKFKESEYLFLVAIIEELQRTKTLLPRGSPRCLRKIKLPRGHKAKFWGIDLGCKIDSQPTSSNHPVHPHEVIKAMKTTEAAEALKKAIERKGEMRRREGARFCASLPPRFRAVARSIVPQCSISYLCPRPCGSSENTQRTSTILHRTTGSRGHPRARSGGLFGGLFWGHFWGSY